jgi:hypothetical protein
MTLPTIPPTYPTNPNQVASLLREMEERIRWKRFCQQDALMDAIKVLLKSPVGPQLKQLEATLGPEGDADVPAVSVKQIQLKAAQFGFEDLHDLARDCCLLADGLPDPSKAHKAILEALQIPEADLGIIRGVDGFRGVGASDVEIDRSYDEGGGQEKREGGEDDNASGDIVDGHREVNCGVIDVARQEGDEEHSLSQAGSLPEPNVLFKQASTCSNKIITANVRTLAQCIARSRQGNADE